MEQIFIDRLALINDIKDNLSKLAGDNLDTVIVLFNNFIGTSYAKSFTTVEDMKKAELSLGDIVYTLGYYSENDGGSSVYEIKDYNYYLNSWLPSDCRKVGYAKNKLGTDLMLMDTPVDEYGNHTLDNGLVACLIDKENIKAEQYGAIGDGKFDNSEVFIHLFAHMKKGVLSFKKDAIYLMPQRKQKNIPSIYKTLANPYQPYMCGRNGFCQRPILANIDGVEIVGDNSTLKIADNDWNTKGMADFSMINLYRVIRNLTIHGIIFDSNGLTMGETNSVENHGLAWKAGNTTIDGDKIAPIGNDGVVSEISNVEIYNCEFKNGGTAKIINDCGGDGILIINPMDNSHDIDIHDNKFTNWGRWCFAIDLGGSGERLTNVKFNNNTCIQNEDNLNLGGKYRGLGWIDFEARKCFENLEFKNNYVYGISGFAFNGAGKMTNNVTILGNKIIKPSGRAYQGAYPYMWNFYGVQMKDLIFENNDFSQANGSISLGYTSYNILVKNNIFPTTSDALSIKGVYGDIIIEGNSRSDNKKLVGFAENLSMPTYLTDNEINNPKCNIKFINNNGGIAGKIFDSTNKGKYNFINLTIEGNTMALCNIIAWDSINFTFDPNQIVSSTIAFSCRGAIFTSPTSYNYKSIPNGGGTYNTGDVVAQSSAKKTICTSTGYVPMQGSFGLADSDSIFKSGMTVTKDMHIYTDTDLYIATAAGTLGTALNHKTGTVMCGDVNMLYLCPLAQLTVTNIS